MYFQSEREKGDTQITQRSPLVKAIIRLPLIVLSALYIQLSVLHLDSASTLTSPVFHPFFLLLMTPIFLGLVLETFKNFYNALRAWEV